MNTDNTFTKRAHEENWLPVLELAVEEVFEIMAGCRVKPVKESAEQVKGEFTAMVGLAGALCGIVTVCCDAEAARQIARCMLGSTADSEDQVADALGEICNMIAGNFKNKLAGTDDRCLLSVPTVISGGEYTFHSLVEGEAIETVLMFEGALVVVRLQLQN
ncbi:MAG: chemotaxis protein CheX [Acidobacteriia bacterium]|nr:chemotaxis protein CheX [Terriglobia bacterium]